MENKGLPIEIIQEFKNALQNQPNLSADEVIKIALKITSEHTQITDKSFFPPSQFIVELTEKNPIALNTIMDEWVKRNENERNLDLKSLEINKFELEIKDNGNRREHSSQTKKLVFSTLVISICLIFLSFPIFLGRADIAAWSAAVFASLAAIIHALNRIKK